MSTENKLLAKLKEQEAALKLKIRQAQKAEKKRQADAYAKKCAIVGAAVLAEIDENETLKATLDPIINKRIIAAGDRKIIGLDPLSKKENSKEDTDTKNPASAG